MQSVRFHMGLQLSMRSEVRPTPSLSQRETRSIIVWFHMGLQLSMRNHPAGRQGGPRFTTYSIYPYLWLKLFAMRPLPAGWLRERGPKAPLAPRARARVCVYICQGQGHWWGCRFSRYLPFRTSCLKVIFTFTKKSLKSALIFESPKILLVYFFCT